MADATHPPMISIEPRDPLEVLPPITRQMRKLCDDLDYQIAYVIRGIDAPVRLAARIRLASAGGPVESPLADYPEGWR